MTAAGAAPVLRSISPQDVAAVLELNALNVWALSPMDEDRLIRLLGWADRGDVLDVAGEVAGFVLTFAPGTDYDSANYRAFGELYGGDFYYLDRIVIGDRFRRRGLASVVYDELESVAAPYRRLTLEVNTVPPNEVSMAFHLNRGYVEVARLGDGEDSSKRPGRQYVRKRIVLAVATVDEIGEQENHRNHEMARRQPERRIEIRAALREDIIESCNRRAAHVPCRGKRYDRCRNRNGETQHSASDANSPMRARLSRVNADDITGHKLACVFGHDTKTGEPIVPMRRAEPPSAERQMLGGRLTRAQACASNTGNG